MSPIPTPAPLSIREIGSFHVGGRLIAVTGLPARERVSTAGGPAHPIDPNGEIAAGQMYVQYVRLSGPRGPAPGHCQLDGLWPERCGWAKLMG